MEEVYDEKYDDGSKSIVPDKPAVAEKKARRTRAEIAEAARLKAEKALEERFQKIRNAEEKRKAKRNLTKATKAKVRNEGRQTVKNRVLSAARKLEIPFANEDIKIPSKGAKMEKVEDYLKAAKARYYKRTKLPNSITREALRIAASEGINAALIKRTAKAKTVNAILAAARAKRDKAVGKASGKTARVALRDKIAEHIMEKYNLPNLKEVQKAVCYRATDERKK